MTKLSGDDVMAQLLTLQSTFEEMQMVLPPPVFTEMRGEIIELDFEAKSLTAKFPVERRFANPMGYMQGGMIVAAMDNAIGPLSFVIAPPSVTAQFNTSYLRPILPTDDNIIVIAQLTERTKRQLYFTATVYNTEDKVLAIGHATQTII